MAESLRKFYSDPSFEFSASSGFFKTGGAGHIFTHAVVGGVMSELQGGKFGHGFVSAGLTKAFMSHSGFNYSDGSTPAIVGRTIIAGIVGGTISEMTGGKFANGAITAAMAHLFNKELSEAQKRSNYIKIIEGFKGLSRALAENPKDAIGAMTTDQFRAYYAAAYGMDITDPLALEYYQSSEYNMLGTKNALEQFKYFHQIVGATANEIGDYVLDSFTLRMAKFAGVPSWVIKQYEQYQQLQDWKDLQDDVEQMNHK